MRMNRRRKERADCRSLKKGYYHLSTDGRWEGSLFYTKEQYAYGMCLIGILTLLFDIRIYSFTLMSNHVHIILSGTGSACLDAFDYLRRKISARLVKDGYPPLPEDYWFKLVPVDDPEQMKRDFIYVDRNPYEKHICVPGGYPWGTGYLHYSFVGDMLIGDRAGTLSGRELERRTGTRMSFPEHWQFHPQYGLLPASFIDNSLFTKLFRVPKEYLTNLVKDYESAVQVARSLDESPEYSEEETRDIVETLLQKYYANSSLSKLSPDKKGRLAVILKKEYDMPESIIAHSLGFSEHLVFQFLRSKDYGKR